MYGDLDDPATVLAELNNSVADFRAKAKDRPAAVGEMVWALLASAEFRFNH